MKKLLTVLPNFTILAESNIPEFFDVVGVLRCFCIQENIGEHINVYKITPKSFWHGMNVTNKDFINILINQSKTLEKRVIEELEKFKEKFGQIVLISHNCLQVKNEEALEQIKSNSKLKEVISSIEDNLVFFNSSDLDSLQNILIEEIGFPFMIHRENINEVPKLSRNLINPNYTVPQEK